jgi:hypothetical protein
VSEAEVFLLKQNDTEPGLEVVLRKEDGTPIDLDNYTAIWLHVRLPGGVTFSRAMVKDAEPTSGIARYAWTAADWTGPSQLVVGAHRMEYEGLKGGGGRKSFPNDGDHQLVIRPDIGQAS